MPHIPPLHTRDYPRARAAAQKVVQVHQGLAEFLRHGQTLAQIDQFVARTLDELACRSCFLGYKVPPHPAFPSYACLSLNECIVHGTAGYYLQPMKPGDLLKIDIGVYFEGWVGDAAWTYCFGEPSEQTRRLMNCGKTALAEGVKQLQPGKPFLNWATTVQRIVEKQPPDGCGFHLVRGLGGHGYGRKLHGPPFVSNTVPTYPGEWPDALVLAEPGTLLAVEPMIAVGTGKTRSRRNEWPVFTADDSLSVHYEHDVLITEHGPEVLTAGLEQIPDIIEA
jgi:methionyl aminopeptidase